MVGAWDFICKTIVGFILAKSQKYHMGRVGLAVEHFTRNAIDAGFDPTR